jgi:hypothetical protein
VERVNTVDDIPQALTGSPAQTDLRDHAVATTSAIADASRAVSDPSRAAAETTTARADGSGEVSDPSSEPVRFDTKISVLLRDDLESWQRLNVCAFLASGVAAASPELIGEPYQDANGTAYLAMFRQPVLVLTGSKELLTRAHQRALTRGLPLSLFTSDLFATGHDRANRAAVRAVPTDQLDLVGIAVHGPRNAVDKIFKGARMHP